MSDRKIGGLKYKRAPHAAWRRVENESILLDLKTGVYYSLNETASFIWERLVSGASVPEAAAQLCAEFDVSPEEASRDADALVAKLCREKLLLPA
ncbi:MAG: PqqD family protein [Elusimicrobiota bacterium]